MANIEGEGKCAPHPICVKLDADMRRKITRIANERAGRRYHGGTSWENGAYGKAPTIEIGLQGEAALVDWLTAHGEHPKWNPGFQAKGDGGYDVEVAGFLIDVKTARSSCGSYLIQRYIDGHLRTVCPYIVCAHLRWESVLLHGWQRTQRLIRFQKTPVKKPDAKWYNLVIYPEDLEPMNSFLDLITANKGLAQDALSRW